MLRYFENLPRPLFLLICSYLCLEDRCAKLPMLSNSINQSIDRAQTVHHLAIYIVNSRLSYAHPWTSNIRAGRLPYLQYAQSATVFVDQTGVPSQRRKNIVLSLKKTLLQGRLRSLRIDEHKWPTITSDILPDLPRSTVRIRELSLRVNYAERLIDQSTGKPRSFWLGLKQCTSLKVLRINTDAQPDELQALHDTAPNGLEELLDSLPDSLEDIVIRAAMMPEPTFNPLAKKLNDPTYLPMLKRISMQDLDGTVYTSESIMPQLVTTIMAKTNKLRPIDLYNQGIFPINFMKHSNLVELRMKSILPHESKEVSECHDLWPELNKVHLSFTSDTITDFMPVLHLATQRQVEYCTLLRTDQMTSKQLPVELMENLANIHTLKYLRLETTSTGRLDCSSLSKLLTPGSWSHIEHLELQKVSMSESAFRSILLACPSLRNLQVRDESNRISISSVRILAMVMFYCPSVVLLDIRSDFNSNKKIKIADVRDAFTRYPNPNLDYHLLKSLTMEHLRADPDAFEYLMKRLGASLPNLLFASLPPALDSHLCLYSTRHLRPLITLSQVISGPIEPSEIIHHTPLSRFIKFVPKVVCTEKHVPCNAWHSSRDWMKVGESFDEIVGQAMSGFDPYPVFSKEVNPKDGRTGKQMFYDGLLMLMSKQDQTIMASWADL